MCRLFVVMAGIMIDSLYADLIEPELLKRLHTAMHVATRGNIPRGAGFYGDDMGPCYSNVRTPPATSGSSDWLPCRLAAYRTRRYRRD